MTIHVYTDGACRGNPGPGGWGVVIEGTGGPAKTEELYGAERQTTNNRMELRAAIEALEHFPPGTTIEITTDSEYVRNGITSWMRRWKQNGWRTANREPVKNQDLWQRLEAAAASHDVRWHWVRGHAGHPQNERADELANRGIDELA